MAGLWRRRSGPPVGPLRPPDRGKRGGLLRRLADRRRASFRRLRPTPEGWVFLATGLAVAAAALNTGNNLLYLVLAAMLALVVTSGVLSESSLRGLEVRRRFDDRIFSGRPARGTWVVRSRRRRLPNLALELEEVPGRHARLRGRGAASLPLLAPGCEEQRQALWTFEGRGVHRLDRVRVSTTWPFGILRKWFEVPAPVDVVVYPAPAPDWSAVARRDRGRAGADPSPHSRHGTGDLRGLRDHRQGEDLRQIHWRTSARLRRRVAVERDAEEQGRLLVRVDRPVGPADQRAVRFERTISQATGAVLAAGQARDEVVLRLPAGPLPAARDERERDRLLRRLAVLELDG